MEFQFGAIIENSGTGYGVFFPDLQGCTSAGDTVEEAKANAVEALTLHLQGMLESGHEIPAATPLDQLIAGPGVEEVGRIIVAVSIPGPGGGTPRKIVSIVRESADAPASLRLTFSRSRDVPAPDEGEDDMGGRESYGFRCFLYEEDGTLRRVPLRVADGLARGTDRLPQYANQRLRGLWVVIWREGGLAQTIERIEPFIWPFDERGSAQANLAKMAMEAWEAHDAIERERRAKPGPIADIKPQIARRRLERESRWAPSDTEIKRITGIIFPETADGPIERPRSVVGSTKRKLTVTMEAREALSACWSPATDIIWKISRLGDMDLKAFIQGVEERFDPAEPMMTAFWKGVIAAAEKEIEVRAARKSTKGKWFAALEVYRDVKGEHGVTSSSTLEYQECDGRAKAVAAAREMLVKHAGLFDADVSIEARLYPEIEWAGPVPGPSMPD